MEIKIDTNRDSPEEIKKAIKLLESLLNKDSSYDAEASEGSFNMFGDDAGSAFDDEEDDEPDEDVQITPYDI